MKKNSHPLFQSELFWLLSSILVSFGLLWRTQLGIATQLQLQSSLPQSDWLLPFAIVCIGWLGVAWLKQRQLPRANKVILPILTLFTGISLMLMYRLETPYLNEAGEIVQKVGNAWYVSRQATMFGLGQILIVLCLILPTYLNRLKQYRNLLILFVFGLLVFTARFGILSNSNIAESPRIAINVFFFSFQPVELLKLLFVLYLASYLSDVRTELSQLSWQPFRTIPVPHVPQLFPVLLILAIALLLLVWISDLGATLILVSLLPLLLWVALPRKVFAYLLVIFLLSGVLVYSVMYISLQGIENPRLQNGLARVEERFSQNRDIWAACPSTNDCKSYQILQSVYSISAGGLFGKGAGNGLVKYIPFVHTDLVYAAIAEEWGLLGACGVLVLYGIFLAECLRIARQQTDRSYTQLLASGLASVFALQCFLILGGTTHLLPLTGITVPFISYGGTSILVNSVMVGLLLRISNTTERPQTSLVQQNLLVLQRLNQLGLLGLAFATAYWSLWMNTQLHPAFPKADQRSQNPVAQQRYAAWLKRVERGKILAADGSILVENGENGRIHHDPSLVHVLGETNGLGLGVSGIEAVYNERLLGSGRWDLPTILAQHLNGKWHGNNVQLTIEPNWQNWAEYSLGGYDGAIVVLDAESGAVLAMVSHPLYQPFSPERPVNYQPTEGAYFNRAIDGLYPPGSTFKVVVGTLALQQGLTRTNTFFNFSENQWYSGPCHEKTYGGAVITSCNTPTAMEKMSFLDGFRWSDNILFADLAMQMGVRTFWKATQAFGFNTAIPFDLTVQTGSVAQSPTNLANPAQLAMSGFGQAEVQTTPLHMALIAASIANHGKMPQAYLVDGILQPDGSELEKHHPHTWQRAVNGWAADKMRTVMENAVLEGWASNASVEGVKMGGKTGTAEWVGSVQGWALPHSWYIGFAEVPNTNAEGMRTVAFAVIAEGAGEGSGVAASIVRTMLSATREYSPLNAE